jgi:hypothetical protein
MTIDINSFLAERRNSASTISAPTSETWDILLKLHRDLRFAAERGWFLAPIEAHSRFAFVRGALAEATCDLQTISLLWQRHGRQCNWICDARASNLCFLSVNRECNSLRALCGDSWDWQTTCHFQDNAAVFFAFIHRGQRLRHLGRTVQGISILRASVVVPPSYYVNPTGSALVWVNRTEPLELPEWLLADAGTQGNPTAMPRGPRSSLGQYSKQEEQNYVFGR